MVGRLDTVLEPFATLPGLFITVLEGSVVLFEVRSGPVYRVCVPYDWALHQDKKYVDLP